MSERLNARGEGQVSGHSSGIIGLLLLGIGCCLVTESRPDSFCDPVDCNPPDSSIHRISQARILEWVAIFFSRGFSRPRDQTGIMCLTSDFFLAESPGKSLHLT